MPFYAVTVGHRTGVYSDYDECKRQVSGFSNGSCKKFNTREAAVAHLHEKNVQFEDDSADAAPAPPLPVFFPRRDAHICVPAGGDGACLYTSIRIQQAALFAQGGASWSTQKLRSAAAQYIRQFAAYFSAFLAESAIDGYCARVAHFPPLGVHPRGEPADEIVITALASILNACIAVYSTATPSAAPQLYNEEASPRKTFRVLFTPGAGMGVGHYDALFLHRVEDAALEAAWQEARAAAAEGGELGTSAADARLQEARLREGGLRGDPPATSFR